MKHLKKYENSENISQNEIKMRKLLTEILDFNLYAEKSYENSCTVASDSKEDSVNDIIKKLKNLGLDFDLLFNTNKYNL